MGGRREPNIQTHKLLTLPESLMIGYIKEESTLISWLQHERDDSRNRLEMAERRCAEIADALEKREAQLKEVRSEMDYYQGASSGVIIE